MTEAPVRDRHRREAERFQRLCELAQEPTLRQKLAKIALVHRRIAEQLGEMKPRQEGQAPAKGLRLGRADWAGRYELRFLDGRQEVSPLEIRANSDIVALRIAFILLDACSDLYREFELWQGPRRIAKSSDARGVKRPAQPPEVTAAMQEAILTAMDALLSRNAVSAKGAMAARMSNRLAGALSPKR